MEDDAAAMRRRIASLTAAVSVRSVPRILRPLLDLTLTIQQLKTLTTIVVEQRSTSTSLAAQFGVSLATMSKLVDRLVDQEFVERRIGEIGDQRVRVLSATALGRRVVREFVAARPELGDDVLNGLSDSELRALETGLAAINRELQALEARSPD